MEIGKDCEPYLQSHSVIQILQKPDTIAYSKVFDCLSGFKKYFYSAVPLQHYSISPDILMMCAEDAFSSAQTAFLRNVTSNNYKPDTDYCVSYVKAIFKNIYLELYAREIKRKTNASKYSGNEDNYHGENEGEKRLLQKDYLSLKIEAVLNTLSEEDKKMYRMKYVDQLQQKEIAGLLNILPGAVSTKIKRFRDRFEIAWKNLNNNK